MLQPKACIMPGKENKVCKLCKSLYGLKQTPKQWHEKFDRALSNHGLLLKRINVCTQSVQIKNV